MTHKHMEQSTRSCLPPMIAALAVGAITASSLAGLQRTFRITVENLAPQNGTFQTPVWVGLHDGGYDLFNAGEAADEHLERLAEDGTTDAQVADFMASGNGFAQGVLADGGPLAPGAVVSMEFAISQQDAMDVYFSYASMVIPSNDAFIGNDNQLAHRILDSDGNFLGAEFFVTGEMVWDAGTEVNDEIPMNTAFFGQMMPDTGVEENGMISLHEGFRGSFGNPGEEPSILADPMFSRADFTLPGYPIARFFIEETTIPAPGAVVLLGMVGFAARRRRRNT